MFTLVNTHESEPSLDYKYLITLTPCTSSFYQITSILSHPSFIITSNSDTNELITHLLNQFYQFTEQVDKRLQALEINSTPTSPKYHDITHSVHLTVPHFQHGIRANQLWMNKNFVLSRETFRSRFKLDNVRYYTIWSYKIERNMEREGLMPFILGTVPMP